MNDETPNRIARTNRSGGRAARHAARSSKLSDSMRPVRAGMTGGKYKPLSDADVLKIHEAALTALETIGLADAPPSGVAILTGAGAIQGSDGRIRFPRALVEDMLALSCKDLTLCGRDPVHDLDLSGQRVHYGTAGAAVNMVDVAGNDFRESTLQDLHDAARITDTLDNVHFLQRPMVARDIADNLEMDLNTIYACCAGTTKHVGTSISDPSHAAECLQMAYAIAGGEAKYRDRPFVSMSNCFVVPPMKFATESCEAMEICIRGGMPILLLSAGMSGATAPSTIAGAIVQAVAECLAGVVYVNAMKPGHPAVFGTWPFGLDLRTGSMTVGSGEQALLSAGCAQMHAFYGVPGGAAGGASDSKMPDMQAGWEQMCSASLLGFCHESLILSDDLIGQALRCVRGIEVDDETLALDQMREVCMGGPDKPGVGHYLGTDRTLSHMERDCVYPALGNRMSPKEWVEKDRPNLIEQTIARKEAILATRSAARFDPELDATIRARFKIHLPA